MLTPGRQCQNWTELQDIPLVSAENWRSGWCGKTPAHLVARSTESTETDFPLYSGYYLDEIWKYHPAPHSLHCSLRVGDRQSMLQMVADQFVTGPGGGKNLFQGPGQSHLHLEVKCHNASLLRHLQKYPSVMDWN